MEENDDSTNNMVSNLPLLFANGYPTSLEKITEAQIQKFIPFMVQCSLGNINVPGKEEYNEPEWWPEEIEFSIPITRPKKFQGDWLRKMKEIVKICYQFHKSIFLLRFCSDLAAYEHTWLRFINNHNSTTSLYDRRSNKLLVTFRNENMTYDQPPQRRKCLLQQKTRTQNENNQQQQMVEQALFDIYLCEYCDAELYSEEAFKDHEKICTSDDDDVILCNSPIPENEKQNSSKRSAENESIVENNDKPTHKVSNIAQAELCRDFLLNFELQSNKKLEKPFPNLQSLRNSDNYEDKSCNNSNNNNNAENNIDKLTKDEAQGKKPGRPRNNISTDDIFNHKERKAKVTRNNRTYALTRCPNIPFSSPAGQMLIKTFRSYVNNEYLTERLDRVERFCAAPVLQNGCQKPQKYFGKQRYSSIHSFNCTYKKPQEYSTHKYTFPRKQYFSQYRADSLKFLNDLILKKRCRPITVRLRKITEYDIKRKRRSSLNCHSSSSIVNSDLNIKLIRDQSHGSPKWKITHQQQQQQQKIHLEMQLQKQLKNKHNNPEKLIVVDTIDLCSSDEEQENDLNELAKSKIYFNSDLTLAHYSPTRLSIQKNNSNNVQIEINEDDDDALQIVDECPAQPEHHVIPLQLNTLNSSIAKQPNIELQTLLQKLNTENEITVTPLKKILDPLSLTPIESSNNIIVSGTSIANSLSSNIIEEIRKQNKFEGNFLTANVTNPAKPLQPSVFLFSNYTTNTTGTSNNIPAMILQQQINNSNNQENLISNTSKTINKNKNIEEIWLPNNASVINNLNNNNYNNINNNNLNNIINHNNNNSNNSVNININGLTATASNTNPSITHLRQNSINSVISNSLLLNATASQLHNTNSVAQTPNVAAPTNKLIQLQQLMQYVDNNDVIKKINSPNRTLSIDLTL